MPNCTELKSQYDAAIAANDTTLAASIREQMLTQECPDPAGEGGQSGGGGVGVPPGEN